MKRQSPEAEVIILRLLYLAIIANILDLTAMASLVVGMLSKNSLTNMLKQISVGLLNYHCIIYVVQFHLVLMVTFGKTGIDKVRPSRPSRVPKGIVGTPPESKVIHQSLVVNQLANTVMLANVASE